MNDIVEKIRRFVMEKCEQHKTNEKFGFYDYWNDHISRVVYHAVELAKHYGADIEIVEAWCSITRCFHAVRIWRQEQSSCFQYRNG
ncbi:MAG: hypothetical protein WC125_05075 [Bacteroidales bacterium]